MASINISDLHSAGSNLFSAPESYMSGLTDNKFDSVNGGASPALDELTQKDTALVIGGCSNCSYYIDEWYAD